MTPFATFAKIHVCPLHELENLIDQSSASHVVSVINKHMMPMTPRKIAPKNHLQLAMNDIGGPMEGLVAPNRLHIENLISFIEDWDRANDMVIHCWAGISRSTASFFIALCTLNPDMEEEELARILRSVSPTASPNGLMISNADQLLCRSGRMISAIEQIGRGEMASSGKPFSSPAIVSSSE